MHAELRAVYGASPNDVWAGTMVGLFRWNGSSWTRWMLDGLPDYYVTSIDGSSASDIWAVGNVSGVNSAFMHFDGTRWDAGPGGESAPLLDMIAVQSPTSAWAIGSAYVYRYDGVYWVQVRGFPMEDEHYRGVTGAVEGDIWIWTDATDRILHWDGNGFSEFPIPCPPGAHRELHVWSSGPGDAWATCDNWEALPLVHFEGREWKATSTFAAGAIWGRSASEFYVGYPLSRWNGVALTAIEPPDGWTWVPAFGRVSGSELWVYHWLSESDAAFTSPIYRRAGPTWTPLVRGVSNAQFLDVHVSGRDDAWACAEYGAPWHYDGKAWTREPSEWPPCVAVWSSSASDVWTVGNSIAHWDGVGLQIIAEEGAANAEFHAVWGSGPDDLWVAGTDKASEHGLLGHYSGDAWTWELVARTRELTHLSGSGPNDFWVFGVATSGEDALLIHRMGAREVPPTTFPHQSPRGLRVSADGEQALAITVATGENRFGWALYVWNGRVWTEQTNRARIEAICNADGSPWVISSDLAQLSGEDEEMHAGLGSRVGLTACSIKDGYGWAVGRYGNMARFAPVPQPQSSDQD